MDERSASVPDLSDFLNVHRQGAERRDPKIVSEKSAGPNEKCLCGSGRKYKKCCMFKGVSNQG